MASLTETRKYLAAIEEAINLAPAEADTSGLIAARDDAAYWLDEAVEAKRVADEAAEAKRLKSRKTVTVRELSWDPDSKVQVELELSSIHSDSTWNVYLDGEKIGKISTYTKGSWTADTGTRYGHSYSNDSRADAIRYLLRRAN